MKRVGACLLVTAAIIVASAFVVQRLAAQHGSWTSLSPSVAQPATIAIDYPAEGSIFPPEISPPTLLWRDPEEKAAVWLIAVEFADHSPRVQVRSSGELMRIGEIDPRCVTPMNTPALTSQQAATHAWTPDTPTWEAIKRHSVKRPATVTITGFHEQSLNQAVSQGRVTIQTQR